MNFNNLAECIGSIGASPDTIEAAFKAALVDQEFADLLAPLLKNSGLVTLLNGQTSVVVPHGLASTPASGQIQVTPMKTWSAASEFWFDTLTETTFTIRVDLDPLQDVDFAWRADRA